MLVTDEALEILYASAAFLRDFGCERDDVVGLELSALISAQDLRSTLLLDRKLSQASTRRVDLLVLLDLAGHTRLSRLTLTRDEQRWIVVVEALDRGENLVLDLYRDQRRWSAAIKGSSDGFVFLDLGGRILEHNARFVDLMKFRSGHGVLVGEEALAGTELHTLLDGKDLASIKRRLTALTPTNEVGERFVLGEHTLELRLQSLSLPGTGLIGHAVMIRDISDRLRVEAEQEQRLHDQLRHHEEVISAQQRAIRELSAPLLPITREVTIVPFVGTLDGARLGDITSDILKGIMGTGTRTVLLDLTGVPTLDATATEGLLRLARGLQLLGVRTVLTGIGARVAAMLSEQPSMGKFEIRGSLQDAVAVLLR